MDSADKVLNDLQSVKKWLPIFSAKGHLVFTDLDQPVGGVDAIDVPQPN